MFCLYIIIIIIIYLIFIMEHYSIFKNVLYY